MRLSSNPDIEWQRCHLEILLLVITVALMLSDRMLLGSMMLRVCRRSGARPPPLTVREVCPSRPAARTPHVATSDREWRE